MSRISNSNAFARLLIVACIGGSVITSSGCFSGFDMRKNIPWPELVNYDEPKTPLKMVAMWQDTVKSQPGKPSIRGFGGRIIFYGADATKPVKVDGDLDVFAFVERGDKMDKPSLTASLSLPETRSRNTTAKTNWGIRTASGSRGNGSAAKHCTSP